MRTYAIDPARTADHPTRDPVVTTLMAMLAGLTAVVPETAGVALRTTTPRGELVTLRLFDPDIPVASVVCLVEVSIAEPADPVEITLIYYATRVGAFTDHTTDIDGNGNGTSTVLVERRVNGLLLAPPTAAVGGLADVDTISQAIDILLHTHTTANTRDQAHATLNAAADAAGITTVQYAHRLVHDATSPQPEYGRPSSP